MKLGIKILSAILALYIFVFFAVKFGWTNVRGVVDKQLAQVSALELVTPAWAESEEWQTLKLAILKDKAVLEKVASETDLPARLIVAAIVPEQLRLFHDEREIFKQVFLPLKILGNQTQFSWGVAGLKPETAEKIEQNLLDQTSVFYPGAKYRDLLNLQTTDTDQNSARFARITDEQDRYFSYLYTALYLRQVMSQWEKAGFDISQKPEILATLFNIGFQNSVPKANPQAGGSEIEIAGQKYSFGRLAYEFYYSRELETEFVRN
ncbi:MAG: hypothetical protein AAB364_02515 [Patescibacteria group bacterium]